MKFYQAAEEIQNQNISTNAAVKYSLLVVT